MIASIENNRGLFILRPDGIKLVSGMLKDTKLGSSFKKKVIEYIERCHLEDGGYFFARIPPSSGTDTRIAVKSLAIFGSMPGNPDSIMNFFLNQVKDETLNDINGIFNAIEVIAELGRISPGLRNYARDRIMFRQNEAGGFGNLEDIDVEVASELQQTYQAVKVLKVIGAPFDESKVNRFISSLLNHDGGYGRNGHSTLASTFYATAIYKLLGVNCPATSSTVSYLKKKKNYRMQFIEDLFWMVKSLVNLGERFHFRNEHINFVLKCQRDNGGFSRAPVMGIPTLEYTYYALNILNEAGLL